MLISDQLSYWVLEEHLTVDMSFGEDQVLSYEFVERMQRKMNFCRTDFFVHEHVIVLCSEIIVCCRTETFYA